MNKTAFILALTASSTTSAATCDEYVALMRKEGIRTLVASECITASDARSLKGHWNEILDGPLGSCLVSRAIAGDRNVAAFTVYMEDMNRQRAAQGCPKERKSVSR